MISILAEGKGEREAGPQLVRRILQDRLGEYYILADSKPVVTRGKGELIKRFEAHLSLLAGRPECEGILVLVDSDSDCAEELAKVLASRAEGTSPRSVVVVCPVQEFENWFVCSAESICSSAVIPSDCERVTDPKGWLEDCLPGGYRPTLDQARLVWRIDFDLALPRSRSLRRVVNAITQLVDSIHAGAPVFTP